MLRWKRENNPHTRPRLAPSTVFCPSANTKCSVISIPKRYNFDHFSIFVPLLHFCSWFYLVLLHGILDTVHQNIPYLSNISFSVKMSKCPKGESRRYKSASLYTALNRENGNYSNFLQLLRKYNLKRQPLQFFLKIL